MDSNVEIVAPVVGDIGSCVSALLEGIDGKWPAAAGRLDRRRQGEKGREHRQDGAAADEELRADGLPRRARRAAHRHQGAAGCHPRQRRRQHARSRARRHRHVSAAQAPGRRHLGRHGHRHGLCHRARRSRPASPCSRSKATAPSASPAWRSRRSAGTTCRSASSSSTTTASIAAPTSIAGGSDPATTVFVKGSRYDKMMEAFGGVGVNATTPDELKRAVERGDGFRQADAHQRGDRSGGRQRERPHRQPQPAKQAAQEIKELANSDVPRACDPVNTEPMNTGCPPSRA